MVSLIIPVYLKQEEDYDRFLKRLSREVQSAGCIKEIIFVNDGSTVDVINAISSRVQKFPNLSGCLKWIEYPDNKGKGYAVRKGILSAAQPYIFFTDFDVPYSFDFIKESLWFLETGGVEMTLVDRTLPESSYSGRFLRNISSWIFSMLVRTVVTGGFPDTQAGFKGFRTDIAKKIASQSILNNFAFDVEYIYIALKNNYLIKKLPGIFIQKEETRKSTVHPIKHGISMCLSLLKIISKHRRQNGKAA